MAIWQDLVDDHGFPARYASVRASCVTLRGSAAPEARVVITTAPGEEGQVDYGDGPMVRHPQTGKYRRTRLFVLTLGYSRKSVRLLTWRSSAQIWAELHERAFRRLGGTVRVIVLDNLNEGVLTPDIYDPTLNPLYRDVLAHYGVVALPCRVGDPDRKGKVEAGVGHAQKTPLQRPALRDARGGAGVSRSLGDALGRHAHPRHDEAPGRRDVCRGAARARAAAARAVSLLPLRRPHGASRWLRRSRGRVLRRAARLDRAARPGAVERPPRPAARPEDRPAAARACARPARLASHPRRRTARAHAADDAGAAGPRGDGRPAPRHRLRAHPRARRRGRRPPHPRRARAREEARPGRRRRRRQGRARARRADLSLPAPLSRTPAAGAARRCARSIRSFASSPSTAISSIARQETPHESRRTRSRAPASSASPAWPPSSTPGCARRRPNAGAHRSRLHARHRRTRSGARTGSSSAGTSRRGFRDRRPLARHLRFRFQQEDEPRADLRARDRPLHRAARGRALPRPARHRQEPSRPGDRPRRHPAGLSRHLSRGAHRCSRRSPTRRSTARARPTSPIWRPCRC